MNTIMSTVLTIRLSDELKTNLDQLAKATGRSKSFLAAEAIKNYVELESWQIAKITKAIKKADQGHFASDKKVKEVLEKWHKP